MITKKQVFLQLEPRVQAEPGQVLKLKNVASIYSSDETIQKRLMTLEVQEVSIHKKNQVVSVLEIIKKIKGQHNNIDIVVFGQPEILVNITPMSQPKNKILQYLRVVMVSLVLFIGAAIAIINYHQDVNMAACLQDVHRLVTGESIEQPRLLQISYSLGLGIGMATFFNHVLKKRWKKEPSPLELEVHMYEKNIEQYILDITKHNQGGQ